MLYHCVLAAASLCVFFSIGVLQLWHPVECISFSLSLTDSIGGSESCVYAGFTRCWFNHWTDDRLSQQQRRQIHSPTLSRLPLHFFHCLLCLHASVSVLLSLSYSHDISVVTFFFAHFSLAHLQGLSTGRITHKHTRFLSSCASILIIHHPTKQKKNLPRWVSYKIEQ